MGQIYLNLRSDGVQFNNQITYVAVRPTIGSIPATIGRYFHLHNFRFLLDDKDHWMVLLDSSSLGDKNLLKKVEHELNNRDFLRICASSF